MVDIQGHTKVNGRSYCVWTLKFHPRSLANVDWNMKVVCGAQLLTSILEEFVASMLQDNTMLCILVEMHKYSYNIQNIYEGASLVKWTKKWYGTLKP